MTSTPDAGRSPDDADIDAAFAAIVAGWDEEADDRARARRDEAGPGAGAAGTQEIPPPGQETQGTPPRPQVPLPPAPPEPRRPQFDVAPAGWRVHVPEDIDEDDEDDFEQPNPPLPRGDLRYWAAVVGLVLGPLLFIGWVLTAPHSTNSPLYLAGVLTVGGFVALISKLPERHDDGDDGARV